MFLLKSTTFCYQVIISTLIFESRSKYNNCSNTIGVLPFSISLGPLLKARKCIFRFV